MSVAKSDPKRMLFWAVTFIVPLLVLLIPTNDTFTQQQKFFAAITLWTILMFAFELVDNYIPCIIMPFLFIISGVAPWDLAFAGWHQSIPWQVLGIFLLVNALLRNGLLTRIAYFCLLKTSCTYKGVLWGMYFFGLVFNLFLPGGSCVAMATFAFGICSSLGLKQSKTAAGITLAGAMGYLMPGLFIYVPSNFGLLVSVASSVDSSISMNFVQYLMHNAIFIPFGFIMVFIISKMFKPDIPIDSKELFKQKREELGPMSREEKVSAVGIFIIFLYIITANIHKQDMSYIFVLVPAILAFPCFGVVKKEDIDNINFKFVFFLVTCMSIGFVAASTGISDTIVKLILPTMQHMGSYGVVAMTWLVAVIINFCLTPLAAMASFGVPLTNIALSLNIEPYAILYAFNNGLDQVLFPYEYAIYLIYFSFGMLTMKDFMKFFSTKMLISIVYIMILVVPYWKLIGLL
ncbi:MAG: anion permease [Peptococcaceae bacterium]|nr:anion permease [Peptococcaceae bacterium]